MLSRRKRRVVVPGDAESVKMTLPPLPCVEEKPDSTVHGTVPTACAAGCQKMRSLLASMVQVAVVGPRLLVKLRLSGKVKGVWVFLSHCCAAVIQLSVMMRGSVIMSEALGLLLMA